MKQSKTLAIPRMHFIDSTCRTLFYKTLSKLTQDEIELIETFPGGGHTRFGAPQGRDPSPLFASLKVNHPRAYSRIVLGGTIGGGEAYFHGDIDSQDLSTLVRIFARNRELQLALDSGIGALLSPIQKWIHRLRENSIEGAKKNIHAHYDLGNSFFELFLDETWMYSSALFKSEDTTLAEGQLHKLNRVCQKLRLNPQDHLLEIGTGWGSLAIHAAQHYGCRVTTTTISEEQYKLAVERVRAAGLDGQITVLKKDYRLLEGQYDKLVSIEMIEAVGLNHLNTYFAKCSSLLKPEGQMLLQAIIIRDQFYEHARKSVDFIQRYIFPGSGIPSIASITQATSEVTDFQMAHLEDFGADYARTLREWSVRLDKNKGKMAALGYPDSLYRMWQFYFGYCEGGFSEKSISVAQILFLKPNAKWRSPA